MRDPRPQPRRLSHADFTRLVEGHYAQLSAFLRGIAGHAEQAYDLAQDTFYDAWACGYLSNIPASETVQDTDILAKASPLLLSYQNGSWQIYQHS